MNYIPQVIHRVYAKYTIKNVIEALNCCILQHNQYADIMEHNKQIHEVKKTKS